MTASEAISSELARSADPMAGGKRRVAVVALIMAIAHLWPVWQQALNNWHHDLYSFFPLILVGAVLIAWQRHGDLDLTKVRWGEGPVPFAAGLVCLGLLAFSIRMHSPWPGTLSAIIALRALLRWGLGIEVANQFRAVWWFLLLALPLPLGADRELVVWMQLHASRVASGVLDLLDYRHDITGVFLTFPNYTFEVEDACSGIQSLYAVVSCAALYAVLCRRGAVRTTLLLLAAAFWVFVANVLRIVFVCLAVIKWDLPVSGGLGHEIVGIGSFVVALLMVISTDRCLLFLSPPAEAGAMLQSQRGIMGWLRLRLRSGRTVNKRASSRSFAWFAGGTLLVGFAAATCWQVFSLFQSRQPWFQNLDPNSLVVDGDFLPSDPFGWRLVNFEQVTRKYGDQFGETSRVWTYELHDLHVSLSIDGPFSAWHDLANCYGTLGWKTIEERDHFGTDSRYTEFLQEIGATDDAGPEVRATGENAPFSRQMYALFAAFTVEGREISPPPLVRWGLGNRFPQLTSAFARMIADARDGTESESSGRQPVYQLQIVYSADGVITETERETVRDFFHSMHGLVLEQLEARSQSGESEGSDEI